ncbi:MAG: TIGR02281 family clan AA aspartic protease [Betaproteobacteria bacterium]|nr:TIGR02281 family clan AA aspartic protease [Betaproteobacteria bacterium]
MATGFMKLNCSGSALTLALAALPAAAADVSFVGVIGERAAILVIDGGAPRTVKVGQTFGAVTVVSVERERAVIEVDGARRTLTRGQHFQSASSDRQSTVLAADERGHFFAEGAINNKPVRFVVDTGATVVALPASEAARLGIDYRKGRVGSTRTAGGVVPVYRLTLDAVRVGGIELHGVEALVIEQGLDVALLGMSFLNRVEIRNEGQTMTLLRRF